MQILLSLTVHFDRQLQQFTMNKIFLHEDLEKKIYIEIPPSFVREAELNKVLKLKKAPAIAKSMIWQIRKSDDKPRV